ncbi:acyltransferase [Neorhizobium sp. P12A]|uniref:acyltransferase family protein n=1 Tax=Neorhizobium sp. P12A TaxID=2268027 RepID=UPI00165D9747|nr:acyltransferase [Neorhizobium sp. P12A]
MRQQFVFLSDKVFAINSVLTFNITEVNIGVKDVRREIKTLTGVRGVAAILVVLYHFSITRASGLTSLFTIPHAYMSVDAFFILSGFVLSYNYGWIFLASFKFIDYVSFLYKRFCRIYPAYFFVMCICVPKLFIGMSGNGAREAYDSADVYSNFLMLSVWAVNAKLFIGPSWSVCVEVFCYFIFPLLAAIVARGFLFPIFSILIAYFGIVIISRSQLGVEGSLDIVSGETFYPTLRALCGFVIGMGFSKLATSSISKRLNWNLIFCLGLVALFVSISASLADSVTYLAIATIVLGASAEGAVSRAIFENPLSCFLGKISYSLYLTHALLIAAFAKVIIVLSAALPYAPTYFSIALLYLLTTIALSMVSHSLFEMRIQTLLRGLWPGPKRRPASV